MKYIFKQLTVLIICLKLSSIAFADEKNKNEAIRTFADDTAFVNNSLRIIDTLRFIDINKSLELTEQVLNLSNKNDYKIGIAEGYFFLGTLYFMSDRWDEGKVEIDKSVLISRKEGIKSTLSKCYINLVIYYKSTGVSDSAFHYALSIEKDTSLTISTLNRLKNKTNLADMYAQRSNYTEAIQLLKSGASTAEKMGLFEELAKIYALLGRCYAYSDINMAISFEKQSLKLIQEYELNHLTPLPLNFLSLIYIENMQIDSTLFYSLESLKYLEYMGANDQLNLFINISQSYANLNNVPKALEFHNKARELIDYSDARNKLAFTINEANMLIITGESFKAIGVLQEAENMATGLADIELQRMVYQSYIELYEKINDSSNALKYFKLLKQAEEIINSKRNKETLSIYRIQYEVDLKNKEIETLSVKSKLQQSIIQRNHLFAILLSTGLLLVIVISSFIIFYINRKKKNTEILLRKNEELSNQKYQTLYKESQIMAIREKIAGQEDERARIARELHDGVAGSLTSIKYKFNYLEGSNPTEELDQIKNSISTVLEEVRTISHNLLPPQFSDVSIFQVLNNHIREINKTRQQQFSIQFFPNVGWDNLPTDIQVELYRIVQELCSNISKHSDATKVEIQLTQNDGAINLTIEDNGKSFEYNDNGIGYVNIRKRVSQYNGVFEKSSSKSIGNIYLIKLPIPELQMN